MISDEDHDATGGSTDSGRQDGGPARVKAGEGGVLAKRRGDRVMVTCRTCDDG